MQIKDAIAAAVAHQDLAFDDMLAVVRQIMAGEATPAQIAGLLVALRMKGETVDEITAAASVMRELSLKVESACSPLIDTCGTGGDASGTFNISTAAAFVVAAGGGFVAKHGNNNFKHNSRPTGGSRYCSLCGQNSHTITQGCPNMVNNEGKVVSVMPTMGTCPVCPPKIKQRLNHPSALCPYRRGAPLEHA